MILICGGAGYIGSHMVSFLKERNIEVIVIDNLSNGHKQSICKNVPLYIGDIRDKVFLRKIFKKNKITSVIHFCADSIVKESMKNPIKYYDNNLIGVINLLYIMNEFKVKHIVFSSTAAVYGNPKKIPITEDMDTIPTNAYGETKLAIEKLFKWADYAYNIKFVALRYFNVAGAHETGKIGEDHNPETHLIPILLQTALSKRKDIYIYGNDYLTHDGTCIRDYIHVMDVVNAHKLALDYLIKNNKSNIFNLGTVKGFSVKEIINTVEKIIKRQLKIIIKNRRDGDPSRLIADNKKVKKILRWEPKLSSINNIVSTSWNWHKNNPYGYNDK